MADRGAVPSEMEELGAERPWATWGLRSPSYTDSHVRAQSPFCRGLEVRARRQRPACILFTPELLDQRITLRLFDIGEGKHRVFGNVVAQHAVIGEPNRKRCGRSRGGRILDQPIRAISANAVETLAGFQIALCHGYYLTDRTPERCHRSIAMNGDTADGRADLKVGKVERRVQHVE